jgi:hypothetical protein
MEKGQAMEGQGGLEVAAHTANREALAGAKQGERGVWG